MRSKKIFPEKQFVLLPKMERGYGFEPIDDRRDGYPRNILYHQMNVIFIGFHFDDLKV